MKNGQNNTGLPFVNPLLAFFNEGVGVPVPPWSHLYLQAHLSPIFPVMLGSQAQLSVP